MASIKVVLYKSKTYSDGTHPVMLQIIHNRKIRKESLNIRLTDIEWDSNKNLPKRGVQNYKAIVTLIRTKIANAEKSLMNLESDKENYSISELSSKIKHKKKIISFNDYIKEIIESMYNANRIGNAKTYQTALNRVNDFTKNRELMFTDIDYKFLKQFEAFHLSKGNSINGFNTYLRSIKATYNKAIKEKIVSAEYYPFKDYKMKQKKTIKRAISKEEMQKIVDLSLFEGTAMWHARNYFLFSFFTIGMSWVDMALLKSENVHNDRIIYRRSKTKKEYNIKINTQIKDILDFYLKMNTKYIFPIIKRDDNELDKRNDIKNRLKRYNQNLKKIGKMINSSIPLTSYVSRHSWASIANFSGIHIGVISQGLGHEDIKTTQTYLANFDYSEIDNANENIL